MKFLMVLSAFFAVIGSGSAQQTPDDVFLLLGQSNMVGRAALEPGDDTEIPDCLLWNGTEWESARAPFNRYSRYVRGGKFVQGINPGPTFVKAWKAAHPGRTVGIVCWCRGGTSIEEWHPDHKEPWDLYDEALRQARAAVAAGGVLRGILWHQGESNAGRAELYPQQLRDLVSTLRADLEAPDVPFVFGQAGQWNPDYAEFNEIILTVSETIPVSACVRTDELTNFDPYHFDRRSQHELGRRYAEALLKLINSH